MKFFSTLVVLFIFHINLSTGQSFSNNKDHLLTGTILDGTSGNLPLEYATISVYNNDSTLVAGTITNEKGNFSCRLKPGDYYAVIQFVSYEPKYIRKINIPSDIISVHLGNIVLQPMSAAIAEATVIGEKSEMVIGLDRKIFNVGKDLSNTGKSASDILDNIPSVAVDVDGNVSLRGSQNLQVLIDGKPSGLVSAGNTDALSNLQGNLIDRVEIITNPSARYEAEGMAGIINIVLKKDQGKGVNGSFELSAGYPQNYIAGANINFRREKLNYFLNYGLRYRERPGSGSAYQRFTLPDTSYVTRIDRDRLRTGWSHNIRGGADLFINSRNTLTASLLLSFDNDLNTTGLTYNDYDITDNLQSVSFRQDHEKEIEHNVEFSLSYTKLFKQEDRKLTAFIQYIDDNETEKSDISETISSTQEQVNDDDQILQKSVNEEGERNVLLQADYIHPFAENGKFETGYRSELRTITNPYTVEENNDAGDWISLPDFTNNIIYTENVHAAYLQAGNMFGDFSLQLGLRMEISDVRTHQKVNDESNNRLYTDFFPTIHSSYKFDDFNSLQLSYSRRINRPHFWLLNPFYSFSDSRNIRTGNPNLEPEYTNAIEGGYLLSREEFSFYTGLYGRHTTGVIERVNQVDNSGITFLIPLNLSERKSFGIEGNITIDPFKWWKLNGDFNFYRAITDGDYNGKNLHSDTYSWNTRFNSKITFMKNTDFQAIFFYRAPHETTQGIRKAFYMLNMGLSKDVLKGKGTLTLNARDVLNSRKFRYVLDQPDLYSVIDFRWSSRSISLTFNYRLNQKKKMEENRDENGNGGNFNTNGMEF
jgi:outer membrane receptor protein involved in Fe transport